MRVLAHTPFSLRPYRFQPAFNSPVIPTNPSFNSDPLPFWPQIQSSHQLQEQPEAYQPQVSFPADSNYRSFGHNPTVFPLRAEESNQSCIFRPELRPIPSQSEPDVCVPRTSCHQWKETRSSQAQGSFPVGTPNYGLWTEPDVFPAPSRQNQSDFYFPPDSDLFPLSQTPTVVAHDTQPPLKERRRQQAQLTSRRTPT